VSRSYGFSPEWRKKRAKIRKRQEDRWAAKSSAVTVRKVEDSGAGASVGEAAHGKKGPVHPLGSSSAG
jgi:hypothetical protein